MSFGIDGMNVTYVPCCTGEGGECSCASADYATVRLMYYSSVLNATQRIGAVLVSNTKCYVVFLIQRGVQRRYFILNKIYVHAREKYIFGDDNSVL